MKKGQYELAGRTLTLYHDLAGLEEHLTELSPADKKEIKKMCKA